MGEEMRFSLKKIHEKRKLDGDHFESRWGFVWVAYTVGSM